MSGLIQVMTTGFVLPYLERLEGVADNPSEIDDILNDLEKRILDHKVRGERAFSRVERTSSGLLEITPIGILHIHETVRLADDLREIAEKVFAEHSV